MNDAELIAQGDAIIEAARPRVEPANDRTHVDTILARYDEVDVKLIAKGFPATSAWWRREFERWYRSGKRQFVPRVGRRGGKSSSLSRLGVVEALYGQHEIPPGDVGCVPLISTDKSEALGRLRTIEAILDALGVAWKPCKAPLLGIEIVGMNRAFRVFTASIAGVSGFTAIFIICDEVAKWKDNDTGVNPATEVLASVRPTMATQPNARIALSSSPLGRFDAHYDAFEQGETDFQCVAFAPTWQANPTISEAATHALEPDEATHEREYGAIPQAQAETSLLTEYLIDRARRPLIGAMPYVHGHFYVATMDPATRGNAWSLVVTTRGLDDKRRVVFAKEWRGSPSNPLSPKAIFREIGPELSRYLLSVLYTDQWSFDSLRDHAGDNNIALIGEPWTSQNKSEAYENLLKLHQANLFEVGPEEEIKSDLLGIRKKLTRGGTLYDLASINGRHSDFAPSIAMGAMKATTRPVDHDPVHVGERIDPDKKAFLEGLSKEKVRRERFGGMPATHRRFR